MSDVYILKIIEFPKHIEYNQLKMVSIERKNKISKYRFIQDSYRSFMAAALARYAICKSTEYCNEELVFDVSEYGKPYLKHPSIKKVYFNFSHSGNYVVCAVDDNNCGIDVESNKNYSMDIASHAFYHEEVSYLENLKNTKEAAQYFTFLWTMKEAYIKALGIGLSKALSSFYISKTENGISLIDFENENNIFDVYESIDIDEEYTVSFVGNSKAKYHYITNINLIDYIKDWNACHN